MTSLYPSFDIDPIGTVLVRHGGSTRRMDYSKKYVKVTQSRSCQCCPRWHTGTLKMYPVPILDPENW